MSPSRVRIPPSPLRSVLAPRAGARLPGRRLATMPRPRRGGRAVECGGLENRYPSLGGSRVQIPPPPFNQASLESRPAAVWWFAVSRDLSSQSMGVHRRLWKTRRRPRAFLGVLVDTTKTLCEGKSHGDKNVGGSRSTT